MDKGVSIVIGDLAIKDQAAASGSYGQSSLASGVYNAIESYDNDMDDVVDITAIPVGSGKAAVIILHK